MLLTPDIDPGDALLHHRQAGGIVSLLSHACRTSGAEHDGPGALWMTLV
jgi:hypothetical protein